MTVDRLRSLKQGVLLARFEKRREQFWSRPQAVNIVRQILAAEPDEQQRAFLLKELTALRPRPEYVAAILRERWETDKSLFVRRHAIEAAAELETSGRSLIQPLTKIATGAGDLQLRLSAVRSLRRIVGEKATASRTLQQLQHSLEIRLQIENLEHLIADAERLKREINDKRKRDLLRKLRSLQTRP